NVNSIAFEEGSLYAATDSGIFMRTAGSDWIALLPGSFSVIAAKNSVLYAGGNGIFKSTDKGANWRAIHQGLPPSIDVSSIVVDSHSAVYLGTRDSGIFKSTDVGATWVAISSGLTSNWVSALALQNRTTVYAGTPELGIFRSTDRGATWVAFNDGLPSGFVHALLLTPSGSQLYAATAIGVFLI